MSRLAKLIAGLQILHKYKPNGDFDFQHDEGSFTGPPPHEMSPEDFAALDSYLFRWDPELESWCKFS